MKTFVALIYISLALTGCNGFGQNLPKSDMTVFGYFLKEAQDNYYLIDCSSVQGGQGKKLFNEEDTTTIEGELYHDIFFAKLDPEKFKKDYDHLNYNFGNVVVLYVRGSFERRQVPGEGSREYLVLDNIVGIE